MGSRASAGALTLALALACGACGDPVVVLGDWPGILRIVAGVAPGEPEPQPDSTGRTTQLAQPRGLAADIDGVLFIAEESGRIRTLRSDGRLETLHEPVGCTGACVQRPEALALDGTGGLLIADSRAHRVWRLDLATLELVSLAGSGVEGTTADGVPAAGAAIASPTGIAAAAAGTIYFSERTGARVRAILPDGRLATVAGTGTAGFDGDGSQAATRRVSLPAGLALLGDRLFVADAGNRRVRAVDLTLDFIETVAGNGDAGTLGDGGQGTSAQLTFPSSVAVTADGATLYIGDTLARRVRAVSLLDGIIDAFAGTGEAEYDGEGEEAAETPIGAPTALATSSHGFVYIASGDQGLIWRARVRF